MPFQTWFRTFVVALVLGAGLLPTAPASAQTVTEIVERGEVKIGVLIGAPPYGSIDAQGNAVGYDADVAALVGEYLGAPVELATMTPPARIPALQDGQAGVLVGTLAARPPRAKGVT